MPNKTALVVTSVAPPNMVLRELARGCQENQFQFIVIGDEASPNEFQLDGCCFYSLAQQRELPFRLVRLCPTRHYARKNIGYLIALQSSAALIIETDDDNHPESKFWSPRRRYQAVNVGRDLGWVNVYRFFTDAHIWPRGLPLDQIRSATLSFEDLRQAEVDCPIQQGLANDNPDVDAIYRLTLPLPQSFRTDRRVALGENSWCPFNSQNTSWWRAATPLLYLPSYCSFRMTDIWRSFVAQRIAWANEWNVLFHEPTVSQQRNDHNLILDFRDELPGYLNNGAICEALGRLDIKSGVAHLAENLRLCYEKLVSMGLLSEQELRLVDAWLADLGDLSPSDGVTYHRVGMSKSGVPHSFPTSAMELAASVS